MKALVSLVLAVALIGGIYVVSTGGCAQTQVAGDKLMKKIDSWLGELDVKRKKIENSIGKLDESIEKSHRGKISAEVRLEEFDRQLTAMKKNSDRVKEAIGVLRPHFSATEEVEINGKMMSPEKINSLANDLLDEYESLSSQQGSLETTRKTYQQTHDVLKKQYETSTTQMASLKKKLIDIDIKKKALDDMKTAQKILGESGSISDEFTKLEKEINDLFVDVETGIRLETDKVEQRQAVLNTSESAAEEVLSSTSPDKTEARFKELFGDDGE